jgi:hypothetical protein
MSRRPVAMTDGQSRDGIDRAPTVHLPDGTLVKVRMVGYECEGDVSGEGHYAYTQSSCKKEEPCIFFEPVDRAIEPGIEQEADR